MATSSFRTNPPISDKSCRRSSSRSCSSHPYALSKSVSGDADQHGFIETNTDPHGLKQETWIYADFNKQTLIYADK